MASKDINMSIDNVISALNTKADTNLANSARATEIASIAESAASAANSANIVAQAASELINTSLPTKFDKIGGTISGNTVIDGSLVVTGEINATITGSSESAISATKDSDGNVITNTYLKKTENASGITVSSLLGDIDAETNGQIGRAKALGDTNLNTLVVDGFYIGGKNSSYHTIENGYPTNTANPCSLRVITADKYIFQYFEMSNQLWRRESNNTGTTWTGWLPLAGVADTGNITIYISKSGSDTNSGLNSKYPVLNISRAMRIAKGLAASGNNPSVTFRIDSGNWGDVYFGDLPFTLHLTNFTDTVPNEYSEDIVPCFGTITARHTHLLVNNLQASLIDSYQHACIGIDSGLVRIGELQARYFGRIFIFGGDKSLEVFNSPNNDSFIHCYYESVVSFSSTRSIKFVEPVTKSYFVTVSSLSSVYIRSSYSYMENASFEGNKSYTGTSANLYVYNGVESLPGKSTIAEIGSRINGIITGTPTTEEVRELITQLCITTDDYTNTGNTFLRDDGSFVSPFSILDHNPGYITIETDTPSNWGTREPGIYTFSSITLVDQPVKAIYLLHMHTSSSVYQLLFGISTNGIYYRTANINSSTWTTSFTKIANNDDCVNLSGEQTIEGNKIFSSSLTIARNNPYLYFQELDLEEGINPSGNTWQGIYFSNKDKKAVGGCLYHTFTDGTSMARLCVNGSSVGSMQGFNTSLAICRSADGSTITANAPIPPAESNTYHIATTSWVRDRLTISTEAPSGGINGDIWFRYVE